jgi:hypothetical protein
MSGTLTVIGGQTSLAGLVTLPAAQNPLTLTALQTALTSLSDMVTAQSATYDNTSVGGGSSNATLLVLSNVDSTGATIASAPASYSESFGSSVKGLVVEQPGSETVTGGSSSGLLAVFSSNSSVTFTDGGTGTVAASGNDILNLSGSAWSVFGGNLGNVAINTDSAAANITLTGAGLATGNNTTPSNAVGSYSPVLNVVSEGTRDFILTAAPGDAVATDAVTVTGSANIIDSGADDTITATGSASVSAHFSGQGGGILFINNSDAASQIIAGINTTTGLINTPGSVSVYAGAGGGIYDGGTNGSNYLIGGTGAVTLFAAGASNYLYAQSSVGTNILNTASGSNDTLVATGQTKNNTFFAGSGTESIKSAGTGKQVYFAGTLGSETIIGSTAKTATNEYIFDQSSAQGGGTYTIVNFKPGTGFINLTGADKGVSIKSFEALAGANSGTQIDLTDGSTIKLVGVSTSSFSSTIIGGKDF